MNKVISNKYQESYIEETLPNGDVYKRQGLFYAPVQ